LAIHVNKGLVFAADSRTNAGIDYVASHSKMHTFIFPGDRNIYILTAGSLATSQAVINRIATDNENKKAKFNLLKAKYMHEIADYVGAISQQEQLKHQSAMKESNMSAESSFIVGGQIAGGSCAIFNVYPQGNYIKSSLETPYLQIGESKYGKPILDRIISPSTSLEDAARASLVSLNSTIRSNVSVGPPIELAIHTSDDLSGPYQHTYTVNSPMYKSICKRWNEGLRQAFKELPRFEWEKD
jgi:putative proteasome-type protease